MRNKVILTLLIIFSMLFINCMSYAAESEVYSKLFDVKDNYTSVFSKFKAQAKDDKGGSGTGNTSSGTTGEASCDHDWGDWKSDSDYHYKVCKKCGEVGQKDKHNTNDRGYDWNNHYDVCSVCGKQQNFEHHYFKGLSRCLGDGCYESLSIVSRDCNDLPNYENYYMIGSGQTWEVERDKVNITLNHVPYAKKDTNELLDMYAEIHHFHHGNWEYHADCSYDFATRNSDENERRALDFPASNIKKPLSEWTGDIVNSAPVGPVDPAEFVQSSGTTFTAELPDGHGIIWNFYVGESYVGNEMDCYVKGSGAPCGLNGGAAGSDTASTIMAQVIIAYRDKDGNKIPGAPADEKKSIPVWTYQDISKDASYTADDAKLNKEGYYFVESRKKNVSNIPDTQKTGEKGGKTVHVHPSLGDQRYTIVFVYDPVHIDVVYRDTQGNTIAGSPADICEEPIKKYLDSGLNVSQKADTDKMNRLGYMFVEHRVYETDNHIKNSINSAGAVETDSSESVKYKPSFDKKYVTIAFIYDPLFLDIVYRQENGDLIPRFA